MEIKIFPAKKSDLLTATCDNKQLHSLYSPEKEAMNFVENINCSFNPSLILITEPCLSYCVTFLRKKFYGIPLCAIRYTNEFFQKDYLFDFVFDAKNFKSEFQKKFDDSAIVSALFLQWKPSSLCFAKIDFEVWNEIKDIVEKSRTLLITRSYFEKKWLINSAVFIKYARHFEYLNSKLKTSDSNVLIAASGPSLKISVSCIKKYREKLIVLAVSSAILPLIKNGIFPDLCISTDGGFWAEKHLDILQKYKIPLALPPESFCKKSLLLKIPVIPLDYEDSLLKITKMNFIKTYPSIRCGTVSGTALDFALKNFGGKIFFSGLDLCKTKGFSHFLPNALENDFKSSRINSKEKRISKGSFSSLSLKMYEEYFSSLKINENRQVFRITNSQYKKNELGKIKDIEPKSFEKILKDSKKILNPLFEKKIELSDKEIQENSKNYFYNIKSISQDKKFNERFFVLESLLLKKSKNDDEKKAMNEKILSESKRLFFKLSKILLD